jgi:hypothetical protein
MKSIILFITVLVFYTFAFSAKGKNILSSPLDPQTGTTKKGSEKKFSLSCIVGAGTPVGYSGIELGLDLTSKLQVALGAGMAEGGPHGALISRIRFWTKGSFFTFLGAGVSYGKAIEGPMNDEHADEERFAVKHGFYINGELGVGWRMDSGAQIMVVTGFAGLINMDDAICVENCNVISAGGSQLPTSENSNLWRVMPYVALHIGIAF